MPPLSNGRHELFAQGLAQGKTERAAYEDAGYVPDDANANKLTRNHQISARKAEILGATQERTVETLEKIVRELDEIREAAFNDGQYGPANAAVMGKAKVLGLEVDPRKNERLPFDDVYALIEGKTRGLPNQTRH